MEIHELKPLFEDVQMQKIFADGKTFVDCTPKRELKAILEEYLEQKTKPFFDLKKFVFERFDLPQIPQTGFSSNVTTNIKDHLELLWQALIREPDNRKTSLIPLPFPYIVPGGRFREIYYWDSYFTMLGLQVSGRTNMIENMVNNFSHLINIIGYIPNGNRTYYIGRSQPPFFSLMVKLLSEEMGKEILLKHILQLEKEYSFWMRGAGETSDTNPAMYHAVKMSGGEVMCRYWDNNDGPRPESYREDIELSQQSLQQPQVLFRHIRAAAESGWDFSSRWFKDGNSFAHIHTTEIIPIDLNCLIYHLEKTIAEAHHFSGNNKMKEEFNFYAEKRKEAINKYCWNEEQGFYFDYDFVARKQKQILTLAGVTPLFFEIADSTQAKRVTQTIEEKFLQQGGLSTTVNATGQQWDAPNGWAPLQWMTIKGLENYAFNKLSKEIASRWIKLNDDVYKRTGKLMEKYNVADTSLEAGGGEYPGQDGFGWTNGVLLSLLKKYRLH
jgi:alpha,alpha-trehalase